MEGRDVVGEEDLGGGGISAVGRVEVGVRWCTDEAERMKNAWMY